MIYLINVNSLLIPSIALSTQKILIRPHIESSVECLDFDTQDKSGFSKFIEQLTHADVVCFTVTAYNVAEVMLFCEMLKSQKPDTTTILGGPIVSSEKYSKIILEKYNFIDFVVRGRADTSFLELIKFIEQTDFSPQNQPIEIKNISFRLDQKVIINESEKQDNPDFLTKSPWLEDTDYLLKGYLQKGKGSLPYSSGYGCPCNCSYCYESTAQFTLFPMERVEEELKLILSHEPQSIFFYDSTFGYSRKRGNQLMELVKKYNRSSRISAYVNINHIDSNYCKVAKAANIRFNGIGIQTINNNTCSVLGRPKQETNNILSIINSDMFQVNATAQIGLIYGLPQEGYSEFMQTLDFGLSLRSNDSLGLYRYCCYPGTTIYERCDEYISKSDIDPEIISGPSITKDEVIACNQIASSYYLIRNSFPFTLAAIAHFPNQEKSKIIEQFAQRIEPTLTEQEIEMIHNVSFANKTDEARNKLNHIVSKVTSNAKQYSEVFADSIFSSSSKPRAKKALMDWIKLDIAMKPLFNPNSRFHLEKEFRLESLIHGLYGSKKKSSDINAIYNIGRLLSKNHTMARALIKTLHIPVELFKMYRQVKRRIRS